MILTNKIKQVFLLASNPIHASAVSRLYSEHGVWLQSWLRRRLNCGMQAEDLMHDTFVRVLGKNDASIHIQTPRAWLTHIAKGLVVDQYRKQDIEAAYLHALEELPTQHHPSPEEKIILLEALELVARLLDGLPQRARKVFMLCRLDGVSYKQAAEELDVSVSTIEKDMMLGLRQLMGLHRDT